MIHSHQPRVLSSVVGSLMLTFICLSGQTNPSNPVNSATAISELGSDPDCLHLDLWPVGTAKPGHRTLKDRKAFIEGMSVVAVEAERRYGVPAAAIVAMAAHESAYGFSRLALNANNILGFRFPSDAPSEVGRLSLPKCSGGNLEYAKFADFAHSLRFVALRLSTLPRYAPFTKRYADKDASRRSRDDIVTWVKDISRQGFHAGGDAYVGMIVKIMNDPYSPGDSVRSDNLYKLSGLCISGDC